MELGTKLLDELKPGRASMSTCKKELPNGSTFVYDVHDVALMGLLAVLSSTSKYDISQATNEYNRVM